MWCENVRHLSVAEMENLIRQSWKEVTVSGIQNERKAFNEEQSFVVIRFCFLHTKFYFTKKGILIEDVVLWILYSEKTSIMRSLRKKKYLDWVKKSDSFDIGNWTSSANLWLMTKPFLSRKKNVLLVFLALVWREVKQMYWVEKVKNNVLHRPGIEPGPPAWQASILPLNQRCWHK